ncbi:MAG: polysaccharide biosynthesis/export family protein, partial [Granulosicoccus sp.]|nr:polysaccharide biosynthesis/export family protein [Granulosicoccus sp.]
MMILSWFRCLSGALLGIVLGLVGVSSVMAQSIGPMDITNPSAEAGKTAELLQATPRPKRSRTEPFGANLFRGGFGGEREDGLNPDYIVSPGDQINLRIWGAVEMNNMVTVDPQGNIFVPGVGPVTVGG